VLKSDGVKLKVWVTDDDPNRDDDVDGLVQLVNPTPSRSSSAASWSSVTVYGQRPRYQTRSDVVLFCQIEAIISKLSALNQLGNDWSLQIYRWHILRMNNKIHPDKYFGCVVTLLQ